MNELEQAISNALSIKGEDKKTIDKAYLEFIKANLIIPVEKNINQDDPEVLFLQENGQTFLPVFSNMTYFKQWAADIHDQINIMHLSGVDLLKDVGSDVSVCFNIGTELYKEFYPQEIARMKSIVMKIFKK